MIPHYDSYHVAINDLADTVRGRATCAEHAAFADVLNLVARASHDLDAEWHRSCAPGYALPAIEAVLQPSRIAVASARLTLEMVEQFATALRSCLPADGE